HRRRGPYSGTGRPSQPELPRRRFVEPDEPSAPLAAVSHNRRAATVLGIPGKMRAMGEEALWPRRGVVLTLPGGDGRMPRTDRIAHGLRCGWCRQPDVGR